jgi:hypothetical protein
MKRKKYPQFLADAEARLAKLRSIEDKLDIGNGKSLDDFDANIELYKKKYTDSKTLEATLAGLDALLINLEKTIRDYSEHMLIIVAAKYGNNSEEYAKAGGTLKMDRHKRKKAPKGNGKPAL